MIAELTHVTKNYKDHVVLRDISMQFEEGRFYVLHGASGCGKSTLLNIIGLLDRANSGDVELFGEKNIKPYSRSAEKMLRHKIGYLFQNFALDEGETVLYNMELVLSASKEKKSIVAQALEKVGLAGYETKKVCECSGGEQQRIAIARLLMKPCELILADEPTGNLDRENKQVVFRLLKELQEMGKTLIVVTHDDELMKLGDECIELK